MFQNKIFGDKFREEGVTVEKLRRDLVGKWNGLAALNRERKGAGLKSDVRAEGIQVEEGEEMLPKFWEVVRFFATTHIG
ncbi:hypothetical protein BT69DRAFT_1283821 [Atractiella rhizophila]|nr:hypothetical protein BT69DRAFT_1283821 [Atractiella rhizophila]